MSRRSRAIRDSGPLLWLVPRLAAGLLRLWVRTLRRRDVGREHVETVLATGQPVITAFWHCRLLMMPFLFPPHVATVLISQHRDGELIARIAERLGYATVRGSATRGGVQAFRELLQVLSRGGHVAITPDGPKGPAERVKPGVIELARLSGRPILPAAFGAAPARRLKSWDRFLIPLPFARGVFVWGAPLTVPPELSREAAAELQTVLERRLQAVTAEADRRAAGQPPAEA